MTRAVNFVLPSEQCTTATVCDMGRTEVRTAIGVAPSCALVNNRTVAIAAQIQPKRTIICPETGKQSDELVQGGRPGAEHARRGRAQPQLKLTHHPQLMQNIRLGMRCTLRDEHKPNQCNEIRNRRGRGVGMTGRGVTMRGVSKLLAAGRGQQFAPNCWENLAQKSCDNGITTSGTGITCFKTSPYGKGQL